jgi:hypothetical protein
LAASAVGLLVGAAEVYAAALDVRRPDRSEV